MNFKISTAQVYNRAYLIRALDTPPKFLTSLRTSDTPQLLSEMLLEMKND